jgi:acyl-CoA synthetase (AMP-forming)/AMP-acid ligase II
MRRGSGGGRRAYRRSRQFPSLQGGGDRRGLDPRGDRGFLDGSELFVVGRYKDLIIIRGRNYGAEDIEESIGKVHPALKPYRNIAFSAESGGAERLVVSVEQDSKSSACEITAQEADDIGRLVRRRVLDAHGLAVDVVLVLEPGGTQAPRVPRGVPGGEAAHALRYGTGR